MASEETAVFGAGCFWGVEDGFRQVEGVMDTAVGYAGGSYDSPTYEDICSGTTGHAEVVRITYDPARVSYEQLLGVFWECHDPTTSNRQGPDVGTQYRSAIFFNSPDQERVALASREELERSGRYGDSPIVTEIAALSEFWPAEEYHQQYFEKNGISSCRILK